METSHLRPLVYSLFLLAGCGGGAELILPGDGEPAAIDVVHGDGQSGRVGEPLTDPLVFQVTDSRGRPVEGASVAFDVTSAGPGAGVVPSSTETNSQGLADARVVLGTTVGRQTGQARVVTGEGRQPVQTSFSATALSENANSMAAVAGQDQTGRVGQPLVDRLVVEVTDGFGNPVPGIPITWTADGGGSVSEALVQTGDDGRARVERILGPTVGRQTTVATSPSLAGSPVTFVHTALAGDASSLVIVSGNGQTAAAGSALPADLVVQLVDGDGNGVPGVALSWVVATGGGGAAPENTTTDDQGRAVTRWTLGQVLGEQRIDAVVSGVGFLSFRATATAGAPSFLFIRTQPSASARNGVAFDRQPVVQVRDASGNDVAVAGVQVSVTIGSGGGELSGTRVRGTDAAGRATFTDLAISGAAGKRTLVFNAAGYAGVTSNEIDIAAPPNQSPSASFTSSCAGLSCSFNGDGSSDPDGRVAAWRWNFGDGTGGDGPNPAHAYGSAGTYQVTLTVTDDDGAVGSVSQSVTVNGPPPPQNEPPEADFNWQCEGLTCQFTDASRDRDGIISGRSWNFGDGGNSTEEDPSHTYAVPGQYTVTLTATDDDGASSVSLHEVDPQAQVLEIRRQPSASATAGEPFREQPEIQLRAGGRDVHSAGVSVSASIASGAGNLDGSTTVTTDGNGRAKFSDLSIGGATGPHTLRFVAPGFGEVVSEAIDIQKASSQTRIVSATPEPSSVGQAVRVEFSVSGGGGTPTGTVTVSVSGGTETCSASVATGFCDLTLNASGDRTIAATYGGDQRFGASSDTEGHRVNAPNQPPAAQFTASCTDLTCTFNSAGSTDPDGSIASRNWDFGDAATGTGVSPSHTYATPGTYAVTLTVTDNDGTTGTTSQPVTVTAPNQPPTAAFTPPSCTTGQSCQFTDESDDPDGTIASWSWSFDDGNSSADPDPVHTFASAGNYDVRLTVTDEDGDQGTVTHTVTVADPE